MSEIKRVVVLPRTAEIKEMSFPTRPDLVGICSHEKGGFVSRVQYDSVAAAYDGLPQGAMKDLYTDIAKTYSTQGARSGYLQARERLLLDHGKEFEQSGLRLHADDLHIVDDHANNRGKEYNAVIIDVKSWMGTRPVRGDCSSAALSFNLGENFTAATRLTDAMRYDDATRVADVLRTQGHGRERAQNAAAALTQNPLVTQLA